MGRRSGALMVNLEEEEEEGDGFQGIGDDKHDT